MKQAVRFALFLFSCLVSLQALAVGQATRLWQQNRFGEFERGTSKGVAIGSDGQLELAPALRTIFTSPSTYIWSLASGPDDTAYLASGSPARVYRVTPDGKAAVLFEAKELEVQVLRIGPDGALYAATSPDGKVYRIARTEQPKGASQGTVAQAQSAKPEGSQPAEDEIPTDGSYTAKTFFDPKAKYIWDMVFDASGRLYVATGDQGSIYRVERSGEGRLFFKSDEPHFRSLLLAKDGNLIAGTDGSGLVYRITPGGDGFVLYSAAKKEITALAQDAAGNLYAAGVGDKRGGAPSPAPPPASVLATGTQAGAAVPASSPGPSGGSAIYQLAPDGSPRQIWESREDLIYALEVLKGTTLLVGTGNRGRVYTVDADGGYTDLLKASANQITEFSRSRNGIYMASANLGKLFSVNYGTQADGNFESDVFDAKVFSKWGRAEVLGQGTFELWARSGNVDNPDRNWSEWRKVDLRNPVLDIPSSRFMQWRVLLYPGKTAPSVQSIGINYRPRNLAPVVDDIAVEVGARFPQTNMGRSGNDTVVVGFAPREGPVSASRSEGPATANRDPNWIAVRWASHDENDDDLEYSLYYRGEGETGWRLLKDHITEKNYSFESALLPDGAYFLKVVASDAPSHAPEDALGGEKISHRFVVDTTPPRIEQLLGVLARGQLHVTFRAIDSYSPIKRAEFSVDAGEWQLVEPVGQISDQPTENYDFRTPVRVPVEAGAPSVLEKRAPSAPTGPEASGSGPLPLSDEHVIVVRVYDRYDNMSTAKSVVPSAIGRWPAPSCYTFRRGRKYQDR